MHMGPAQYTNVVKKAIIISMYTYTICFEEVQVGIIRKKRHNQEEIPTPKTEMGKTLLTIRYLYLENMMNQKRGSQIQ